jgi:hypothetical protein
MNDSEAEKSQKSQKFSLDGRFDFFWSRAPSNFNLFAAYAPLEAGGHLVHDILEHWDSDCDDPVPDHLLELVHVPRLFCVHGAFEITPKKEI